MKYSLRVISVLSLWITVGRLGVHFLRTPAGSSSRLSGFQRGKYQLRLPISQAKSPRWTRSISSFSYRRTKQNLFGNRLGGNRRLCKTASLRTGASSAVARFECTKTTVDGKVSDHASTTRIRDLTRAQKWLEEKSALLSKLPAAKVAGRNHQKRSGLQRNRRQGRYVTIWIRICSRKPQC